MESLFSHTTFSCNTRRGNNIRTMHDTYAGHKNVADFVAEDGHEFVELWQQKVGTLYKCWVQASELT